MGLEAFAILPGHAVSPKSKYKYASAWVVTGRPFKRLLIQANENENVTQAASTGDRLQRSFNPHLQNLLLSAKQPDNSIATNHLFQQKEMLP